MWVERAGCPPLPTDDARSCHTTHVCWQGKRATHTSSAAYIVVPELFTHHPISLPFRPDRNCRIWHTMNVAITCVWGPILQAASKQSASSLDNICCACVYILVCLRRLLSFKESDEKLMSLWINPQWKHPILSLKKIQNSFLKNKGSFWESSDNLEKTYAQTRITGKTLNRH